MDIKEHSNLPQFSEEKPGFFDKFIDGFVNIFGSKMHFALASVGAVLLIAALFFQGYNKWLLTTGLASNNYESAIEYFLAVATLYQTARITIKQATQSSHLQKETDEIDALLKQNTELTKQIHNMTLEMHNNNLSKERK